MQLHFSAQESNLLADILWNRGAPPGVMDQVLSRHLQFDFDELDFLLQTVVAYKQELAVQIRQVADAATTAKIEARQLLLDSMSEKIDEARSHGLTNGETGASPVP